MLMLTINDKEMCKFTICSLFGDNVSFSQLFFFAIGELQKKKFRDLDLNENLLVSSFF